MGLTIYNLRKWLKIINGKSILHVNQGVGKVYSTSEIKGYYNDLSEKVTKDKKVNEIVIPTTGVENGSEVEFPIAIFQYGLGAYDLYLIEGKDLFFKKFTLCADWALKNQEENGAWNTFFFKYPQKPYSAMAQGEGISLLLRAYQEFKDKKYLEAATNAVKFMILSEKEGGVTKYENNEVFFQEVADRPTILNGWIFSLFGLFDYIKIVNDPKVHQIYNRSIQTIVNRLSDFDNGYWSKYDTASMITSPFYHKLHIAQLDVMYELTKEETFKFYSNKWRLYEEKRINRNRAFTVKVVQKLLE